MRIDSGLTEHRRSIYKRIGEKELDLHVHDPTNRAQPVDLSDRRVAELRGRSRTPS